MCNFVTTVQKYRVGGGLISVPEILKLSSLCVCVINPRRACAARVIVVVLCVCLFVSDYSRTTGYEAAYERYQQLQCYKGKKKIVAISLKRLRSRDMAWKHAKKSICKMSTGLPRLGIARSAHRGRMKLLRGYVSKSSAALNPLTITQLACELSKHEK